MGQKVLRFEHHLNASKTKTLTMGLDVNTLQTIITLSTRYISPLPKSYGSSTTLTNGQGNT